MIRLFFISLMLTGCASAPQKPLITQNQAAQMIVANKASLFRDPSSIRDAEIGEPYAAVFGSTRVCIRVNAKNAYGGYTGLRIERILFINGNISPMGEPGIYENCGQFTPFPELNGRP